MKREILGGKIHSARVTNSNLDYEGSIEIDTDLLDAAGILLYERVYIYNVSNGSRFDTYTIPGRRGSGVIGVNGAAARLVQRGDKVIIVSFVQLDDEELRTHKPTIIVMDEKNRIAKTIRHSIKRKS